MSQHQLKLFTKMIQHLYYVSQTSYSGLRSTSNSGNLYTTGQCTYYAFDRRAELGKPIHW